MNFMSRLAQKWSAWISLLVVLSEVVWAGDTQRERIYEAVVSRLAGDSQSVRGALLPQDLDLSAVVPLRDEVTLDLAAVNWNAVLERWEFRLRCRVTNECVPFLVAARMDRSADFRLLGSLDIPRAGTARSQRAASVSKTEKKVPVIEAGQNAQVVVARPSLQITAQVVCLERGVKGQWIRVRTREGRARVFRAEVVSAGLLSVEQGALR